MPRLMDFADLLKYYRSKHGWSHRVLQDQVAKLQRGSVAVRTISDLERRASKTARKDTVTLLADTFGLQGRERRLFERAGAGDLVPAPDDLLPPHNLPARPADLIGRDRDRDDLAALLTPTVGDERSLTVPRLVTIVGPVGCGKSRLALQVAWAVTESYPDGVWRVDLGAFTESTAVPRAIAAVLDLSLPAAEEIGRAVTLHLRDHRTLLLLDNCDPVFTGCEALIATLLAYCPRLNILATARRPLAGDSTQRWPLGPLAPAQAAELFTARAALADPRFTSTDADAMVIADLCGRLDGLPLALELAAARLSTLPLAQLGARLDEVLDEVSGRLCPNYRALDQRDQAALRHLSIFVDGCTPEALAAVCPDLPDAALATGCCARLAVGSFLTVEHPVGGPPRYRAFGVVRRFGLRKLTAHNELDATRQRHCDWLSTLAETVALPLHGGPAGSGWYQRLRPEHANVRAALTWAREHDRARALRLAGAIWPNWFATQDHTWGRGLLRDLLPAPAARADWRARAHYGLAVLTVWHDGEAARHDLAEAAALAASLVDPALSEAIRWVRAYIELSIGALAEAERLIDEGLAAAGSGKQRGLSAVYRMLHGYLALQRGELAAGYDALLAALEDATAAEQTLIQCMILARLGEISLKRNEVGRALDQYTALGAAAESTDAELYRLIAGYRLGMVYEALDDLDGAEQAYESFLLRAGQGVGTRLEQCATLLGLGRTALARRDYRRALLQLEQALALAERLNQQPFVSQIIYLLGLAEWHVGQRDAASGHLVRALALRFQHGDPSWLALILEGLASLAVTQQQGYLAAQWLGAADQLRQQAQTPRSLQVARDYHAAVEATRGVLGEEKFAAAWDGGQRLPLAELVEHGQAWLLASSHT